MSMQQDITQIKAYIPPTCKYCLQESCTILGDKYEDVLTLRSYITNVLGIEISLPITYKFWEKVSESFDACWLDIDFMYVGVSRKATITQLLEKFGTIIHTN